MDCTDELCVKLRAAKLIEFSGMAIYDHELELSWDVEEKIKEIKLEDEYADQLEKITSEGLDPYVNSPQFALLHATAEQRCRAALEAIKHRVITDFPR